MLDYLGVVRLWMDSPALNSQDGTLIHGRFSVSMDYTAAMHEYVTDLMKRKL